MSFSSGDTTEYAAPEPKLMGLDKSRISTAEQARPLPVFWGIKALGVTFVSNAFDQRIDAVTKEVSKKEDPITVGYNYFCSFAAVICAGPVHHIFEVRLNDEKLVDFVPTDPTGEFDSIVIPQHGTIRFYWGSETQDFDSDLTRLSADTAIGRNPLGLKDPANRIEEHSALRGQCRIVAEDFYLGYNVNQVPTLTFVLGRWPDLPTGNWTGMATRIGNDYAPMAVLIDVLTHPRYGLGLLDSIATGKDIVFDRTSIMAVSAALTADGCASSPDIDRVQSAQEFLLKLLADFDAFYRTDAQGRIAAGLVRKVPCGAPTTVPLFDEACLCDLPEVQAGSMEDAVNEVTVTFTDAENSLLENSVTANAPANIAAGATPNKLVLARPWITSAALAEKVARAAAHSMSLPAITGTLTVRKSKLQGLQAGDPFYFSYAHYGICWMHCRALEVNAEDPHKPEVKVLFEQDRCQAYPGAYNTAANVIAEKVTHVPVDVDTLEFVPLEVPWYKPLVPPTLLPGDAVVSLIIAKPTAMTDSIAIREDAGGHWTVLGFATKWSFKGDLITSIINPTDDPTTIQVHLFKGVELTIPQEIVGGDPGANEFNWLLLIRNEFFKVTAISPGTPTDENDADTIPWTLTVEREALDTRRSDQNVEGDPMGSGQAYHSTDRVWLTKWGTLQGNAVLIRNRHFALDDHINLKFQSLVGNAYSAMPAQATQLQYKERTRRPWCPKHVEGPDTYNGTQPLTFTWQTANRDGGLVFTSAMFGIEYVIDIRAATDMTFNYTGWTQGPLTRYLSGNIGTLVVQMADIYKYISHSFPSLTVRIFAQQAGMKSLFYYELTVTRV